MPQNKDFHFQVLVGGVPLPEYTVESPDGNKIYIESDLFTHVSYTVPGSEVVAGEVETQNWPVTPYHVRVTAHSHTPTSFFRLFVDGQKNKGLAIAPCESRIVRGFRDGNSVREFLFSMPRFARNAGDRISADVHSKVGTIEVVCFNGSMKKKLKKVRRYKRVQFTQANKKDSSHITEGNFMMATTKVGHVIKQKRQRSKVSYWDVSSIRSQLEVRYHMKTTLNDMGITTVSRNSGMVKNASRVSADVNRPYIEQVKQCRRGGDCPNFSTRIAAKNLYSENGGNDALSFMPPAASSSNTEPEVIVIDDDDDNDNDDDDNVGIADRFHVICNASDTVLHLRKDDTTGPRVKEECVLPVDGAADTSQGGAGEKSAHQTDSRKKRAKRKVTDSSSGKIKTEPDDVSPVKKTVLSAVQEGCVVYEIIDDNNMIRLRGAGKPKDARHVKKSVVSRVQEDDDEHESLDNNKVIGVCGGGKPKDVSKVQEDDDEHESLDNNNIIGVCEGGKPKDATPVKETVSSVQEDSVEHEILDDNNMIGVCGEPKDATPVKKTLSRVQEDGLENLDGKEHKKHDGNGEKSGVSYVQIDGIELENLDGKEHKEHDGNGRIDDKCAAGKSGEKSGVSNVQEDGVENENLDGDVEGEKQVGNGRIDKCVVGETGDGAPSENSGVSNSQEHGVEPENLNDDHITDIRRAGQPADDSPGKNPGVPNNQEEYVERENENRNGNTSDGCGIGVPSDDKPVVRSIAPNVQEDDVLGKNPDKNLSVYTSGVEKTGNEGVSHASPSGEVVIPVASAAETSPSDSTEVDVNVGLPYNDNALPEPVLHSSTEESK